MDPIEQPGSKTSTEQPLSDSRARNNSIAFFICGALAMLTAIGVAALAGFIVPSFAMIFASFGADLPLPTALVLRLHPLLWLAVPAALACLVTGLFVARRTMTHLLIVQGFGNLLLGAGCIVSLYLPIFSLSQVR